MSHIIETTDATFDADVLGGRDVVLLDIWSPSCGPCLAMLPALEQVAEEYQGRAKVVKINAQANPETAVRFGVRFVPTLIVFKDGEKLESVNGARSKAELAQMIDKYL